MLPRSLDEAEVEETLTRFDELENGQRFVDGNNIIYEKIDPGEAMVVSGEQAGEFVYPSPNTAVKRIHLKKQ